VTGTSLAWVWPASPDLPVPAAEALAGPVHAAVRIGFERTLEQDPGLGLRQLIDPACKALSPAVNDPYTAIQAIEHLSVLYAALARRPVGPLVAHDRSGTVTAAVPARSFAELLAIGVGLIRRYGAQEPTVIQALLRMLTTVATTGGADDPDVATALEREANLLVAAAEREAQEPADLAVVYTEAETLRHALSARSGKASPAPAATGEPAAPPPT
jgi:uncharacterized membrane protein